jgi:anaerobic ribonucleoside-triphosphate reductase activating protein
MQGCTIGCKGCVSHDTWDFDQGKRADIVRLMEWVQKTCGTAVDGVTISGGEPFDQPDALLTLLQALRKWFATLTAQDAKRRDILCYSGYPWKRLRALNSDVISLLDVVVPEPYAAQRPITSLRGSDNQTIECLTDLGRERYTHWTLSKSKKTFQLMIDSNHEMWAIGIPDKGDMQRLASSLGQDGLEMCGTSWMA